MGCTIACSLGQRRENSGRKTRDSHLFPSAGLVDSYDFNILAGRFGAALGPAAARAFPKQSPFAELKHREEQPLAELA